MKHWAHGILLLSLVIAAPASARDIDGINVPDSVRVPESKAPLILNGAGYRTRLLINVYIGALYTSAPVTKPERVLRSTSPRVMWFHFVRAVDRESLSKAWKDSFTSNQSAFEYQGLRTRLQQFNAYMPDAGKNDVLQIDLLPRGVTRVSVNGKERGQVAGTDFQRAVLRAWIGDKPADSDLKKAVLRGGH